MNAPAHSVLVLALGNDLLGDDAVGLIAARHLQAAFANDFHFVEASGGGLDLLDALEGYRRALLLDSIHTGLHEPGTILELSREDFQSVAAGSPHYVGLPEALHLAEQLGMMTPHDLRILAMEVENPFDFRQGLSPSVARALPDFMERAKRILVKWRWEKEGVH